MLGRERPWDDQHCVEALPPPTRRRTWHGSPDGGSPDPKGRRSTWQESQAACVRAHSESEPLVPKAAAPLGLLQRLRSLRRHYGLNLLVLIFAVQHVMKGFVMNFTVVAELFLYRSYGVPATEIQFFNALTGLPWAMKPMMGLVSDIFPVFGYRKTPYALLTSLIGALAYLLVGVAPKAMARVPVLVLCLFLQTLQITTSDVLTQGTFTQHVQETSSPRLRRDLLSFAWSGVDLGALAAVLSSGAVIQFWGPTRAYLIATFPSAMLFVLGAKGCYEDRWLSKAEINEMRKHFFDQKEACILSVLMLASSIVLIYSAAATLDPSVHFVISVSIAVLVLLSFTLVLSPVLAKMNAFNFLFSILSLSIEAASFYFCTDTREQYPEGPHFSVLFYSTVRGAVQFVFSLVGIYSFQRLSPGWTYRAWLIMATILYAMANVLNVMMFERVNLSMGIPDWIWMLCSTALCSIVDKWKWMPRVVSISYMSPRGMEVTMFALLMGCNNLGWAISANFGALLLFQLGIRPSGAVGESKQFEHLWLAAAWTSIFLPIFVLLFGRLLPHVTMDTSLVGEAADAATAGSLWRRLTRGSQTAEQSAS